MSLETIFSAKWRWVLIISMIFLGVVSFVDMIFCSLYFSKIQPWMSSTYLGIQYNALIVTIVFTAVSIANILLIFLLAFFAKKCSENEKLASSLFTLLHLFTLISFISSILSIYMILKEERFGFSAMYDLDFDSNYPFCYNCYIQAMIDALDKINEIDDMEDFLGWCFKFMDRIFIEKNPMVTQEMINNITRVESAVIHYISDPKSKTQKFLTVIYGYVVSVGYGKVNNKLCKPTANPILALAILILIGTFFDFIALKINGGCGRQSKNIDDSKDEDPAEN